MLSEVEFNNFDDYTCTSKSYYSNLYRYNPTTIIRKVWWNDEDTQLEKRFQNN